MKHELADIPAWAHIIGMPAVSVAAATPALSECQTSRDVVARGQAAFIHARPTYIDFDIRLEQTLLADIRDEAVSLGRLLTNAFPTSSATGQATRFGQTGLGALAATHPGRKSH